MDRETLKLKLEKFNAMVNDDVMSRKVRDAIHDTMSDDVLIAAKASAPLFSKVPEGPLQELMLAAIIEAAIAFIFVQGKLIIKEVQK